MSAAETPPDLRVLLVELAREFNRVRPGSVLDDEINRVNGAQNTLLVLSRVLCSMAKRAGVPDEAVDRAVARARRANAPKQEDMFKPAKVGDLAQVVTVDTDWDVVEQVDQVLLRCRARLPGWFVDEFWPGCLRRAAQGQRLTERERAVALYQASQARGER